MTTPECPKGPERGARPEETSSLRNRIESAIVWARHDYDHNENLVISREAAANAAWSEVEPELERLTAEVERLRELALDKDEARQGWFSAAGKERDEKLAALAEVSRLREQLAAQPHVPIDASDHVFAALERVTGVHTGGQLGDQTDVVMNLLKSWGVSFSGPVSPTSEATPIVHTVLLSSDTGVMGEWQAFCSGCRQRSVGDLAHAEFWKDQHLADVLVPHIQASSKLEQNLVLDELSRQSQEFEGRPSVEDAVLFAVAQDRVRRDKGERHTLEDVAAELELLDEGRPSGSGAAAPHSDDTLVAHLRLLVSRLKDNVRTGEEKGLPNEIAHDDGWSGALVHAGHELETLLDQYGPNGWDPAAQAARSEATPMMLAPDPAWPHIVGTYELADLPPEVSCTEQEAEK